MDFSFSELNFNSVETLPGYQARAAFTVNSASVFREDVDIVPTIVDDTLSYIPWGGDNQMPFDLLALVEKDETLATCQCFNAEVCYGSGRNIGSPYSVPRASPTAASNRPVSSPKNSRFSTSSQVPRTAAKPGSRRSTSRPTERSSTTW